jgi:fructuronate reductase
MKLSLDGIKNREAYKAAGVTLPEFDIEAAIAETKESPTWIHFGAGNIFRGFVANAQQKIMNQGLSKAGIVAVDSFDFEVIHKAYRPFDNLSVLVTMRADGVFENTVIGSITESLVANKNESADYNRVVEIFENPTLQMVSFTITEKGYSLRKPDGDFLGVVAQDIEKGPEEALHTMSIIASLMYKRFLAGKAPVTLVSMDNCSHNGDKLKEAVITVASQWALKGYVSNDFLDYLKDEKSVAYPLSMIDKITPRPSEEVGRSLVETGIEDMSLIRTSRDTFIAPYVNAEVAEYLVIEDSFTNGRPQLEEAGIIFTDRDTVNNVETMKVTTCLNPLHTALAVGGCLLGHTLIADEMKDQELKTLITKIGYEEGLKTVINPGIIDPKAFIDEVMNERFANPFIPDTPQRIATDTSQKVGIRYGVTIKSYVEDDNLEPSTLVGIPLAIALWCRYLLGSDDEGNDFELSPDPLLEEVSTIVKSGDLRDLLSNESIFGLDLYSVGLGEKIEGYFKNMSQGDGAVRATLKANL